MSIFKELKLKIKNEQKELASTIRILKAARKPHVYESNPKLYDSLGDLERHQYEYRHVHIAYCMFFNNTEYGDIERTCLEDPSEWKLDKLKSDWNGIIEEAKDDEALHTSS